MRCAECGLYECCMRTPLGGCPNGEKVDPAEIITTTNMTWEGVDVERYLDEVRGVDVDLIDAAQDLVDAVGGYIAPKKGDKYVFRGEVLEKCNKVKKLLGK